MDGNARLPSNGRTAHGCGCHAALTPFAGILVFLAIWQIGCRDLQGAGLPAAARPTEIFQTFVERVPEAACTTAGSRPTRCCSATRSPSRSPSRSRSRSPRRERFDRFVMPTMLFFQVVPKVAIAPLFLVWFGVGATAEDPGRVPDLVLSDRDRRRGGPALDVVRDERSRALDGREPRCRCSRSSACRPACPTCSAA